MLKLYKHIDGVLHYHEAWVSAGTITEHWGVVGERGESRESAATPDQPEEVAVASVLQTALDDGFHPIELFEHFTLLIEYNIAGLGTSKDLTKRHIL